MNAKLNTQAIDDSSLETSTDEALSQVIPRASRSSAIHPLPGLAAAQAVSCDDERRLVTLQFAETRATALLHSSVESVVIRRAIQRNELVIVQQQSEGLLVIGVLRTSATPGLDVGDEYEIEARRIKVTAAHELLLTSGPARLVLSALGHIESVAKRITSRASAVHKIIGRAIQLN